MTVCFELSLEGFARLPRRARLMLPKHSISVARRKERLRFYLPGASFLKIAGPTGEGIRPRARPAPRANA